MANASASTDAVAPVRSWIPVVALAWLVPGGGHFLLKRYGRGGLLLLSVASMFLFGLMMRGAMFKPKAGDLLTVSHLLRRISRQPDASGLLFFLACGWDTRSLTLPGTFMTTAPSFWWPRAC